MLFDALWVGFTSLDGNFCFGLFVVWCFMICVSFVLILLRMLFDYFDGWFGVFWLNCAFIVVTVCACWLDYLCCVVICFCCDLFWVCWVYCCALTINLVWCIVVFAVCLFWMVWLWDFGGLVGFDLSFGFWLKFIMYMLVVVLLGCYLTLVRFGYCGWNFGLDGGLFVLVA